MHQPVTQKQFKREAIRREDLKEGAGPYLPICFCTDTSMSMQRTRGGTPTGEYIPLGNGIWGQVVTGGVTRMEVLNQALQQFCRSVYEDDDARGAVEFSVVAFDDNARVVQRPTRTERIGRQPDGSLTARGQFLPPELKAGGSRTSLGAGINLALDQLEQMREDYKRMGIDHYQPWLVILTDGADNGSRAELERARQRIRDLVGRKKLAVYPIAVGEQADLSQLNSLSPRQKAFRLTTGQILPLFCWLAKSTGVVSSGELGNDSSPLMEEYEVTSWSNGLN